MDVELELVRERLEPGRTFSAAALDRLGAEVAKAVAVCVAERWDSTGEPPTVVRLTMSIEAQ